jgi:hypothetical protein
MKSLKIREKTELMKSKEKKNIKTYEDEERNIDS